MEKTTIPNHFECIIMFCWAIDTYIYIGRSVSEWPVSDRPVSHRPVLNKPILHILVLHRPMLCSLYNFSLKSLLFYKIVCMLNIIDYWFIRR